MSANTQTENRPACFVVMPFDRTFTRVYELILAPACRQAGFEPERADSSVASERITSHLLTRLLESEMVLGDLSSRNPNVLYEIGVRHACGGGTVLVHSSGTERIFDIQDIRTTEYDARLTEDSIRHDIELIAAQIRSTYERGRAENLIYRTAGSLGSVGRQDHGYRGFLRRLDRVNGQIRLLVTFAYFLNDKELLRNAFARLGANGHNARILLADPGSPAALQRGHDRPGKDVPAEIRCNLRNIADCLPCMESKAHDGLFECRVYDSLPPFALYQCGGEATMIFYEYRKDLKDTQSLTFSTATPLGQYVIGVFEDFWKNADTCMSIEDYLTIRGWFGTYLHGVRYLRGRECAGNSGSRPDFWLLLNREQHSQVTPYIAGDEPVAIDDVAPGQYLVEQHPIDPVRRIAVQKYGETVANDFTVALAATRRRKTTMSAGRA